MSTTDNKDQNPHSLEVPPFLEILGFSGAHANDDETFTCEFNPGVNLTHSNGMIVQGGFVTGMLDSCMAQQLIFKSEGALIPLTLDIDVKFFNACAPGPVVTVGKVIKQGKSIAFTEASLFQNDKLIASSTATKAYCAKRSSFLASFLLKCFNGSKFLSSQANLVLNFSVLK